MYAFRHKISHKFMYFTIETDSWGQNANVSLVEMKDVHKYNELGIFVLSRKEQMENIVITYEEKKATHEEFKGSIHEPVMYVPLEEYHIVELGVI